MQAVIHVNGAHPQTLRWIRGKSGQQRRGVDATTERHEHTHIRKTCQQISEAG
jgi:hypothetical protein